MTEKITKESLLAALTAAVEKKGADYCYKHIKGQCFYTYGGHPSCIFGHALTTLGVEIDPAWNRYGGTPIDQVLRALGVYDRELERATSQAQSAQDFGASWGHVLDTFTNALGLDA